MLAELKTLKTPPTHHDSSCWWFYKNLFL